MRGTGAPLVTNHLAVAGLSTGKVVALDTQTGVPVWEQRVAVPQGRSELERIVDIDGGLLLSGGTLYVASYQGTDGRTEQWRQPEHPQLLKRPAAHDQRRAAGACAPP